MVIKGEVMGSEELAIDGQVDGRIELRDHSLTIGPTAQIQAQVVAKTVTILGTVTGNVTASEKVDIRETGSVEGDVIAPRLVMADGAHLCGRVEVQPRTGAAKIDDENRTDHIVGLDTFGGTSPTAAAVA